MLPNIFQELFRQCDVFSSEIKKSSLLKDYNHLIVDIEKFKKSLQSITQNGTHVIPAKFDSVDFSWKELLKDFISKHTPEISNSIFEAAVYIDECSQIIQKYASIKNQQIRTQYGNILIEKEDLINSFIDNKIYPISSITEKLQSAVLKNNESVSEIEKWHKEIVNNNKELRATISSEISHIKSELASNQNNLRDQIDFRIIQLADEKIKKAEEIYNKTLSLSSSIAGKVISNDFSRSSTREKNWADILRTIGFITLFLCAAILYKKSSSFTLENPESISANDYINLIKTSAVSIFLISMSILCLKESSKHRIQQYFYENQSLKIASLSPLIADIDKEKQDSVKQEVAKYLFSAEQKINVTDDSSSAFLGMTKILEKLIDKK